MQPPYLLDTDIASYVIKGSAPRLEARLVKLDAGRVFISVITRAELRFGALRLPKAHRLLEEVDRFLSGIHSLPWDDQAADRFAEVRTALERKGTPIGVMDTMIAAHALSLRAIRVTNNLKYFRRVPGLAAENWAN